MARRSVLLLCVLLPCMGLVLCLLAEVAVRIGFAARPKLADPDRKLVLPYGWLSTCPPPGQQPKCRDGFRRFGDPGTTRTKVLVLGDSFTQATNVLDGNTYYDRLAEQGFEIFAYGAGGYGTLQESMVLDDNIGRIRPDLILWQFCDNDFINNDFELESHSRRHNNHMIRPYWEHGRIDLRYPTRAPSWLVPAMKRSMLIRLLQVFFIDSREGTVESFLTVTDPRFRRSVDSTTAIMQHVVDRARPAKVVAFSVNALDSVWGEGFKEVCRRAGVPLVEAVGETVRAHKQAGEAVEFVHNWHWNARGHAIAAEVLIAYLQSHGWSSREGAAPSADR